MNKSRVPSNPSVTYLLQPGLEVDAALYKQLWTRANQVIPSLPWGRERKSCSIYGDDFWSTLSRGERILAGKVLAHWVMTRKVPLEFACCPKCTTKEYRRI